jgi:hypothetical protein
MRKTRESFFEFSWNVPENGYQWVEAQRAAGPGRGPDKGAEFERVLVEIPSGRYRSYNPLLEYPALFRKFATLDQNEAAIQAFANKFGALSLGNVRGFPVLGDYFSTVNMGYFWTAEAEGVGRQEVHGDSFNAWRQRIVTMRQAVDIWALVRNGDRVALERFIHWAEGPEIHCRYPGRGVSLIASPIYHPELLSRVPPGNTIIAAKMFLVRELQENLTGRVSWRPVLSESGDVCSRVVPQSLLGCLWLELEDAITGDRTQIPCPVCSEWFEVRSSGVRSDKMYCSPRCKTRAHRDLIERARHLRAKGKSPQQIAEAINREVDVVRKWVKTKKGR